jgi:pimeloyl-ACP methyl ester carboxylesterase
MDSFSRSGLVFDVRDAGPDGGEPVVLLHGFPQDSSAFDRMAPVLASAGLRTLAPDQRGYSPGARPEGRSAYTMREVVDDVLALLESAGLSSAHLVGHDWGGVAAWALAAWHPWRVRTLTALSVAHPAAMAQAMVHSDQALRSAYAGFFQLPLVPEGVLLAGGGTVLRRMLSRGGLPDDRVQQYVDRMREPGALTAALNWYRAMPAATRTPVGTVGVPTLHVWGARDTVLSRAATESCAEFVDAPYTLEVLEDIGHWIPELAGERTGALISAHIRAHS